MIIILDKIEDENMAYSLIKELAADPNKWDRMRNDLIVDTPIPHDELKLMVDCYIE